MTHLEECWRNSWQIDPEWASLYVVQSVYTCPHGLSPQRTPDTLCVAHLVCVCTRVLWDSGWGGSESCEESTSCYRTVEFR